MGFQIRKRTKGKNGWLNFSKSGVSHSTKVGNVTTNVSKRGVRTTVNLGNGVRYVTQRSWKNRQGKYYTVDLANSLYIVSIIGLILYFIKQYML